MEHNSHMSSILPILQAHLSIHKSNAPRVVSNGACNLPRDADVSGRDNESRGLAGNDLAGEGGT